MARSTVDEPNGAKAKAAGAEGTRHTPRWREMTYGITDYRIDGDSLESLRVWVKIGTDGEISKSLLDGIYEPHFVHEKHEVYVNRGPCDSGFETVTESYLTCWRKAEPSEQERFETAYNAEGQREIAAAQNHLHAVVAKYPPLIKPES